MKSNTAVKVLGHLVKEFFELKVKKLNGFYKPWWGSDSDGGPQFHRTCPLGPCCCPYPRGHSGRCSLCSWSSCRTKHDTLDTLADLPLRLLADIGASSRRGRRTLARLARWEEGPMSDDKDENDPPSMPRC